MKKATIVLLLASTLLAGCQSSAGDGGFDAGFPKPTKPYTPDLAVKNGDVANVHGTYRNLDKWNRFRTHVESGSPEKAQVRIAEYTIEGEPIFSELTYDGERIHFTYDNSMDHFGTDLGRPGSVCTGIGRTTGDDGNGYFVLTGCNSEAGGYFHLRATSEK